ncbi:MAG: hypothetical protein IJ646_06065, partial [Clostridia bacterium]|nr:hypothetical protein [Clostridia bacterium]
MERRAFIIRAAEGRREAVAAALEGRADALKQEAERSQVDNFSVWNVADLFLCYGEERADGAKALADRLVEAAGEGTELLCAPGTMRLMYHDIGVVREDKSLIRHRVFCTKLKPGCEEEYKRRHDALVEARGGRVSEGPDSNFTIWYGA